MDESRHGRRFLHTRRRGDRSGVGGVAAGGGAGQDLRDAAALHPLDGEAHAPELDAFAQDRRCELKNTTLPDPLANDPGAGVQKPAVITTVKVTSADGNLSIYHHAPGGAGGGTSPLATGEVSSEMEGVPFLGYWYVMGCAHSGVTVPTVSFEVGWREP
jgi:hypothetical protein